MIKNISILIKLAFVFCFFLNFSLNAQNTCDWIEQYAIENEISYDYNQGVISLHYCENIYDDLVLEQNSFNGQLINDVLWSYITNDGLECQDWSGTDENGNYYFSVDFNDPCLQTAESISVLFEATLEDNSIVQCEFNIDFFIPGQPYVGVDNFNIDEQIVLCEENTNINLFASAYGTSPNNSYVNHQWYINGNPIPNSNSPSINIAETNFEINSSNTYYFTVTNYCSPDTNGDGIADEISSDWITVSIFEGYDDCEPCKWEFPDEDKNEFFGFSPNNDGLNDFFPEMINNIQNRNDDSHITCQATSYKVTIYNRYGRKIFESNENNEPWDGKNNNGKVCKDGTYFYKIEYVLNPLVEQNNQDEKKVKYGSVHLAN